MKKTVSQATKCCRASFKEKKESQPINLDLLQKNGNFEMLLKQLSSGSNCCYEERH